MALGVLFINISRTIIRLTEIISILVRGDGIIVDLPEKILSKEKTYAGTIEEIIKKLYFDISS